MKSVVSIEGMSCGHCVMRVKSALEAVPGVSGVSVDLTSGKASVEGPSLDANMLRQAVEKAGYEAVSILP
jgi:copper chaperone